MSSSERPRPNFRIARNGTAFAHGHPSILFRRSSWSKFKVRNFADRSSDRLEIPSWLFSIAEFLMTIYSAFSGPLVQPPADPETDIGPRSKETSRIVGINRGGACEVAGPGLRGANKRSGVALPLTAR